MARRDEGFDIGATQTVLLSLLLQRPRHAYDIAREVKRLSEGRLPFRFGTLYPQLYRMERDGLVTSVIEQPQGERQRRVYHLTDHGREEAVRAVEAWNQFSQAMDRIVNSGGQPA